MTDGVKNKNQEPNVRVIDIVEIISEAKEIN